jgi:uncharacterized membrane protein YgcG
MMLCLIFGIERSHPHLRLQEEVGRAAAPLRVRVYPGQDLRSRSLRSTSGKRPGRGSGGSFSHGGGVHGEVS